MATRRGDNSDGPTVKPGRGWMPGSSTRIRKNPMRHWRSDFLFHDHKGKWISGVDRGKCEGFRVNRNVDEENLLTSQDLRDFNLLLNGLEQAGPLERLSSDFQDFSTRSYAVHTSLEKPVALQDLSIPSRHWHGSCSFHILDFSSIKNLLIHLKPFMQLMHISAAFPPLLVGKLTHVTCIFQAVEICHQLVVPPFQTDQNFSSAPVE
ncbi:hypothetical protein J3A83DRAFT_4190054 [Scleroderma citrinum]